MSCTSTNTPSNLGILQCMLLDLGFHEHCLGYPVIQVDMKKEFRDASDKIELCRQAWEGKCACTDCLKLIAPSVSAFFLSPLFSSTSSCLFFHSVAAVVEGERFTTLATEICSHSLIVFDGRAHYYASPQHVFLCIGFLMSNYLAVMNIFRLCLIWTLPFPYCHSVCILVMFLECILRLD